MQDDGTITAHYELLAAIVCQWRKDAKTPNEQKSLAQFLDVPVDKLPRPTNITKWR